LGLLDDAGKAIGIDQGASEPSADRRSADELPVKAAFLVAGFLGKLDLPDFDGINETFVCRKFDWTRIKRNAGEIFVWNGEEDPYVPLEKGQQLAQSLSVPMMLIPAGGHLNEESGYTSFPLLFEKISALLD
jgi:predicted alpha/beta hydrolase family esterase